MPFSDEFEDLYRLGIKPACSETGFTAERVDEQKFSESILERIYRQIAGAEIVIAVMTGRNANVFYEVGYAHALDKRCVLITSDEKDIPFDLKHHRHIIYEGSISLLRERLNNELSWQFSEIQQRKKKTISATLRKTFGNLVKSSVYARADIDLDIDLKNSSSRRIKELEAIYLHTGKDWTFSQNNEECPKDVSTLDSYAEKHFIRSPVSSLSLDAWAPLKLSGSKYLAFAGEGVEILDSYRLAGHVTIEVMTSQGSFREKLDLDVDVDEIPF